MKNKLVRLTMCLLVILLPLDTVLAVGLAERMRGKILLQVQSHGEAWYVSKTDSNRYYMADGKAAMNVMRSLGVGITNSNLNKLKSDKKLAKKHAGKIFLQIEEGGQAYYVNFDGTLYYLKDGKSAYSIMRSLGVGIKDADLYKIPESPLSLSSGVVGNRSSGDSTQITTKDIAPYLSGIVEVICKKKDEAGAEKIYGTGSGSLWSFSDGSYNVLTNKHVVAGSDVCVIWTPDNSGVISTSNGTYYLDLDNEKSWNDIADEAVFPLLMPKNYDSTLTNIGAFNLPISSLNYKVSELRYCDNTISQASPVMVIGYPAFSSINSMDNESGVFKNQISTNGIISGYDSSSKSKGLPHSNYYVSSIIDSGNSGGVAFSKDSRGMCLLGLPTWIVTGNYSNQGLVQNINNVTWDNPYNTSTTESKNQTCQNNYGSYSVWNGQMNSQGGVVCDCASGYAWNTNQTSCVVDNDSICRSVFGNNVIWDGKYNTSGKPTCLCQTGYSWGATGSECTSDVALLSECRASYGIGSYSRNDKDDGTGKAVCDCLSGYIWNYSMTQCVIY